MASTAAVADLTRVAATKTGAAARTSESGASVFDVWTHTGRGLAANPDRSLESSDPAVRAAVAARRNETSRASLDNVGDAMAAQASSFSHQLGLLTGLSAPAPGEVAPSGVLGHVGATFAALTSLEQLISAPLSAIPFPAFPAVRITDMDVGLPHAHMHPPNLIPPAPPVPLPSTGPLIPIPILSGASRTLINGLPAARCGDLGLGIWCGGYFPMYEVFLGSSSVWIEGGRAARMAVDITKHCMFSAPKPSDPPAGPMIGMTISASPNVIIGGVPMPSLLSMAMGAALRGLFGAFSRVVQKIKAARALKAAERLAQEANPTGSVINCGHNVDAVLDRLYGRNPHAVSPAGQDGSFAQIGSRNGTNIQWGNTLNDAFDVVERGGPGTTAIVGIDYGNGASHVVVVTNVHGTPTILEGQNWGAGQGAGAITDRSAAAARYPASDVGIGVVPGTAPPL